MGRVPMVAINNHRCVADRCRWTGQEMIRMIAIMRWAEWCLCGWGYRRLVFGNGYSVAENPVEDRKNGGYGGGIWCGHDASEIRGETQLLLPTLPDTIILSLLFAPTPPSLSLSQSHAILCYCCYAIMCDVCSVQLQFTLLQFLYYSTLSNQNRPPKRFQVFVAPLNLRTTQHHGIIKVRFGNIN